MRATGETGLICAQRRLYGARSMRLCRTALVWLTCGLWAPGAVAQELSPRYYWPAPRGTKVGVLGYAYSTGEVLMDRSLPVEDLDSRLNLTFLAYMQTFSLWHRTANIVVEVPYSWGTTEGRLYGYPAQRDFSGFGDLAVALAVNLIGAPSMAVADFQELRANPRPLVGASLKVVAPTGQYYDDRLINVGANRWAAKPGSARRWTRIAASGTEH